MSYIKQKKRPEMLTWLCIGSALAGSLWIIMLLALIFFSLSGNVPFRLFPGIALDYLHVGYLFVLAEVMLTFVGLAGVRKMWQMKKSGFYLYATSKILIYFLPAVWIDTNYLSFPGLVITSILITAYGVLLAVVPGFPKKFDCKT